MGLFDKTDKGNVMEMVPEREENIDWERSEDETLTLIIKREGLVDRFFQKVFKTPKTTRLELDELGSFVWEQINGTRDVGRIAKRLKKELPEKSKPLYKRLITFLRLLLNNGLISLEQKDKK